MIIIGAAGRIRTLFYQKTMDSIKEKYKKDKEFHVDRLTEKELKCLAEHEVLLPSPYNSYEPLKDVEFLLEIRQMKHLSEAQLLKKKILDRNIRERMSTCLKGA